MAKTLYVGNIPWATTEDELTKALSAYGEIQACRIITDRDSGRSRGYGFVEVDEEAAESILDQANGLELEGRQLVINEAKPREQTR